MDSKLHDLLRVLVGRTFGTAVVDDHDGEPIDDDAEFARQLLAELSPTSSHSSTAAATSRKKGAR